MKLKTFLIMVLAVGVVLLLAPRSLSAAEVDGAKVYKEKCAMCHGEDGKGETKMGKSMKLKDLGSEEVQKQSNEALEEIIEKGKGKMPAYKSKLKEDEIDAVVKHIRAFAPKKK